MAILGFGTVTSVVFLVIAMLKTIGNNDWYIFCIQVLTFEIALTYFDIKDEINDSEIEDKRVRVK